MRKILFITWDGPETSYLEGLFLPIFLKIEAESNFKFFIVQFGWLDEKKLNRIKKITSEFKVVYKYVEIPRKPSIHLGALFTLVKGIAVIRAFCRDYKIDIVMPRSIFPASIINLAKIKQPVIYDADGFPIEERLENASLKRSSFLYKLMKYHEQRILNTSETVLTRSNKAIDLHITNNPKLRKEKFFKVVNGRNERTFQFDLTDRTRIRRELGIGENEVVFVYCGSIGPKYAIDEMLNIFSKFHKKHTHSKLLILTSQKAQAKKHLSSDIENSVILKHVNSTEVAFYLSAADIGLAIIYPFDSMKGVAPIKLGEYLLMNLYVITSKGIGDVEEVLRDTSDHYIVDLKSSNYIDSVLAELDDFDLSKSRYNREVGLNHYSLEKSVNSYLEALSSYK